jgi:protoheme IX farnesyltransferase
MKPASLKTILSLLKYKVSVAVTFTALTGYLVCTGSFDLRILKLILGVFILAGGASALNQFQEREFDARMERTKHRPIPAGEIAPRKALLISILFIIAGLILLYAGFGFIPALLGLFNIVWYNLVYTTLKRITPFAVVPGSLVGAVPACIGWTSAGGYLFEPAIIFIALFLFIWQIPHFWLLMLKYGNEYQAAGFPTINQTIDPASLKRIILVWIVATSFSSILIPLFLVKLSLAFFILIFVLNILFVSIFAKLSFGKMTEMHLMKSFISINVYMVVVLLLLIAYHIVVA